MAVREPDPRILAAEDALAGYQSDCGWLFTTYYDQLHDIELKVLQPPIAKYGAEPVDNSLASDPTWERAKRLLVLDERASKIAKRIEAVDNALRAMPFESAIVLRLYYFEITPFDTLERVLHVDRRTLYRRKIKGLEVVALMLEAVGQLDACPITVPPP